ncbi:hypothetical protein [Bosea sp. 117]|uniref:hypothetical protein n=1 Tax=Bosea sp. 117 TaxID=1125973 RepID=UPI00068B1E19|nr:hypothetical protein [Bosea sp. 117]
MIEAIMYSALGFLVASLIALLILPAVWRRAVRLTTKRIEGAIPVSMAEIQADKDQQRAEFAVAARRLELDVDSYRTQVVSQSGELLKRADRIAALEQGLEERARDIAELTAGGDNLAERLRQTEEERDANARAQERTEGELGITRRELAITTERLEEQRTLAENLRIENVALTTQVGTLSDRIGDLERELSGTQARLADDRSALRQTVEQLSGERGRLAGTTSELMTSRTTAEKLTIDLAAATAEIARLSGIARDAEAARSSAEALAGEADSARQAAEAMARQAQEAYDRLRAETTLLEGALAQVREDRARLQADLVTGDDGAGDARAENAMLRERISDIAAEVARLTAALEGPDSPIEHILASAKGTAGASTLPLAERIRALQARAGAVRNAAPEREEAPAAE